MDSSENKQDIFYRFTWWIRGYEKNIPHIQHIGSTDALELARAIAGAKFFIGNQSFFFAVAEALKVKRALEVCYQTPNVIVEGKMRMFSTFSHNLRKWSTRRYI